MNDEALNRSIRKFLKTVGVNSQLAIEKAVRQSLQSGQLKGDELLRAQMILKIDGVGVCIEFEGELGLSEFQERRPNILAKWIDRPKLAERP